MGGTVLIGGEEIIGSVVQIIVMVLMGGAVL